MIGVTGQFSAVDKFLTGDENLALMADLRHLGGRDGRRRAAELLDRFDLVESARKHVSTWSGGMQRRLDLAMTLGGDPRIVFLDEPTAGLDPRSRRTMWQAIRDLVKAGVTIFLTTQYLEEADRLADRIAVLDHGRLVAEGSPSELLTLLSFLGSGFVPTQTMPDGLRWFAANQPFTPITEPLRGLLLGTPIGTSGPIAVAWCVAISLFGFLWARRLYERDPAHR